LCANASIGPLTITSRNPKSRKRFALRAVETDVVPPGSQRSLVHERGIAAALIELLIQSGILYVDHRAIAVRLIEDESLWIDTESAKTHTQTSESLSLVWPTRPFRT
jgi:hypothetical protein